MRRFNTKKSDKAQIEYLFKLVFETRKDTSAVIGQVNITRNTMYLMFNLKETDGYLPEAYIHLDTPRQRRDVDRAIQKTLRYLKEGK